MSVIQYTSDPAHYAAHPLYRRYVSSVRAIAIDHRREYADGAWKEPACGHKSGWPDTSMIALPPECQTSGCKVGYAVELFGGRVFGTRERNGYHDSDFFATIVRDDGTTFEFEYASTRGWTYFNGATVDVTDNLRDKANKVRAETQRLALEEAERERAVLDAITPSVGKTVRVKSTRSKIPHGTVGRVVWFGESQYGYRYPSPVAAAYIPNANHPGRDLSSYRVGIMVDGKRMFASATCFEIIE